MKLFIAGGGTGGHVNPGLAIAKYVRERRPDTKVRFGGTEKGIEKKLVPREGYKLETIDVEGFRRSMRPRDCLYNLGAAAKAATAVTKAKKALQGYGPDCVVGCGGYASYPFVQAAQKMGIPTVLLEVNALPGVVTKKMAPKASAVLVSFEETRARLDNRSNIHRTGAPVRPEIVFANKEEARSRLGIPPAQKLVVSFWGSMGALYMNRHMAGFVALESREDRFSHIHATGTAAAKWLPELIAEKGVDLKAHPNIELREYIYNMADVMAAADVVICRGGAATIGELCVLGKPAIIVPSPYVAENHQEKNARALEKNNACVVITEAECTPELLYQTTTQLLFDEARLAAMGKNAAKMAVFDSSEKIYQYILQAVGR